LESMQVQAVSLLWPRWKSFPYVVGPSTVFSTLLKRGTRMTCCSMRECSESIWATMKNHITRITRQNHRQITLSHWRKVLEKLPTTEKRSKAPPPS
jgi:hypothetical protein